MGEGGRRLRDFQDRQLRDRVAHAVRSVPYYRELLRSAGVAPDDLRGAEEIVAIPRSTKDDLRRWPESARTAAGRSRAVRLMTNGSRGKPFSVLRTPAEELALGAIREHASARWGARPRHRTASLRDPSFGRKRLLPGRLVARAGLFRRHGLDAQLPRGELAEELIRLSPDLLGGYASVIAHVAYAVGERKPGWRPRLVLSGGETLTAVARRAIESGFGARVVNTYGAAEFNLLAYDCPRGADTLHVCDEGVILEVVRDGKPAHVGESGAVIATALHSCTMPFLRYETGDRAVRGPQPCPCGWPGTTLLSVEGRLIESFHLPGGRWLHPVNIVGAIGDLEQGWVDEHRLIQEEEDLVIIQFVPLREPPGRQLEEVRRRAGEVLGPEVRVRVELVDRMPKEASLKRRPFMSRVAERNEGTRSL
jgi:phenylacetate-CoA ligase